MAKSHSDNPFSVVFSTNPDFKFEVNDEPAEAFPPGKQTLRLHLERQKGNGEATVIKGFLGSENERAELVKTMKNRFAAGGSVRENGDLIVQGNHRDKILEALLKMGFSNTKKAGG